MFEGFPWTAWLRGARDPLRALGRLERDVMEIVWRGGEPSVREVQTALTRPIAYTTVMMTLDRLFKKGLVSRRREGRAFLYSAAQTREQMAAALTGGVLRGLFADAPGDARPKRIIDFSVTGRWRRCWPSTSKKWASRTSN